MQAVSCRCFLWALVFSRSFSHADSSVASKGVVHALTEEGHVRSNSDKCSELNGIQDESSNKCFFIPSATLGETWPKGELLCQSHGGHLASIASEAENVVVHSLYASGAGDNAPNGSLRGVWIGLTDAGYYPQEGHFYWSDGSRADFRSWAEEQPDDLNSNQDCVAMMGSDGAWEDQECDSKFQVLCSKDLSGGEIAENAAQATEVQLDEKEGGQPAKPISMSSDGLWVLVGIGISVGMLMIVVGTVLVVRWRRDGGAETERQQEEKLKAASDLVFWMPTDVNRQESKGPTEVAPQQSRDLEAGSREHTSLDEITPEPSWSCHSLTVST